MTAPTHSFFSLIFYFLLAGTTGLLKIDPITVGFLILGSLIPDIDTATSAIGRTCFPIAAAIEKKWGHRTVTHSFVGLIAISVIVAPFFFLGRGYYYALIVGYASHILIDCCNKQGPMIFWPSAIRGVLPGRKEYRIQVASSAEFVLLAIFVAVSGILLPLSARGFTKSLHWMLGDIGSAVRDYQDYTTDYETFVELEAVDNLSYEKVKGRFKVVGNIGKNTLVVACSPELRTAGNYEDNNWRPTKARIIKGEPVKFVTQEVDMAHRLLGDIQWFLDNRYHQRIYGSIETIDQVNLPYMVDLYNSVTARGKSLVFKYGSLQDIKKFALENVYVKEGKLMITTELKEGEHLEQIDANRASMLKSRFSEKYDIAFSIEDKQEVLIKRGDKVEAGQVIAKIGRKIKEVENIEKELENLNAQIKILTGEKESLQIVAKRNKIEEFRIELEKARKEGERLVIERKDKIDHLERKKELLTQQKKMQEREWEKTQVLKTQFEIDEAEAEIQKLAAKEDKLPDESEDKIKKIEREIEGTKEELRFITEGTSSLEVMRAQNRINDLLAQKEDAENKAIIQSQVSGIVADVNYSMTMEYLTRVQITILTNGEENIEIAKGGQ